MSGFIVSRKRRTSSGRTPLVSAHPSADAASFHARVLSALRVCARRAKVSLRVARAQASSDACCSIGTEDA